MDPSYPPQAPQPALQPPPTNPYEFIMNPQKPQKPKMLGGGNSLVRMLVFIVGGAVILMVVIGLAISLLGGGKKSVAEELVSIAQIQNELIRVANQGTNNGVQQATKNLAVTTEYALRTQQDATIKYLAQNNRVLAKGETSLKQDARTDQQLAVAKSTSTFDLVFSQIMQSELTDYATSLKQVFTHSENPKTRELLSKYYEQTQMLISQVPYTQETIENAQ